MHDGEQVHPSRKCDEIVSGVVVNPYTDIHMHMGNVHCAYYQAVVGILPKLVLAVTACLEGTSTKASYTCGSKNILPSDPMVTFGALGVLEVLLFSLRSTMRPHLRRVQIVSTPWLQVQPPPSSLHLNWVLLMFFISPYSLVSRGMHIAPRINAPELVLCRARKSRISR